MIIGIVLLLFLIGKLARAAAIGIARRHPAEKRTDEPRQKPQPAPRLRKRQAPAAVAGTDPLLDSLATWTALDDLQLSRLLKDAAS